jgi:hypothetical protein
MEQRALNHESLRNKICCERGGAFAPKNDSQSPRSCIFPAPRQRGRGTTRSVVEGARAATQLRCRRSDNESKLARIILCLSESFFAVVTVLRRQRSGISDAPSTAQERGPPPPLSRGRINGIAPRIILHFERIRLVLCHCPSTTTKRRSPSTTTKRNLRCPLHRARARSPSPAVAGADELALRIIHRTGRSPCARAQTAPARRYSPASIPEGAGAHRIASRAARSSRCA